MPLSQHKVNSASRCPGCACGTLSSSDQECGGDLLHMNRDNAFCLPLWEMYVDRKKWFILLKWTDQSGLTCLFFRNISPVNQGWVAYSIYLSCHHFALMVYLSVPFHGFLSPKPVTPLCTALTLTQYSGYVFLYSCSSQTAFS